MVADMDISIGIDSIEFLCKDATKFIPSGHFTIKLIFTYI